MDSAFAALASVVILSPGFKICPTSSGHRYVSPGTTFAASTRRFVEETPVPLETKYTVKFLLTVSVFVTVALSMMVATGAVYLSVVPTASSTGATRTFGVTLMATCQMLLLTVTMIDGIAGTGAAAAAYKS